MRLQLILGDGPMLQSFFFSPPFPFVPSYTCSSLFLAYLWPLFSLFVLSLPCCLFLFTYLIFFLGRSALHFLRCSFFPVILLLSAAIFPSSVVISTSILTFHPHYLYSLSSSVSVPTCHRHFPSSLSILIYILTYHPFIPVSIPLSSNLIFYPCCFSCFSFSIRLTLFTSLPYLTRFFATPVVSLSFLMSQYSTPYSLFLTFIFLSHTSFPTCFYRFVPPPLPLTFLFPSAQVFLSLLLQYSSLASSPSFSPLFTPSLTPWKIVLYPLLFSSSFCFFIPLCRDASSSPLQTPTTPHYHYTFFLTFLLA